MAAQPTLSAFVDNADDVPFGTLPYPVEYCLLSISIAHVHVISSPFWEPSVHPNAVPAFIRPPISGIFCVKVGDTLLVRTLSKLLSPLWCS